jgi:hypothetical protein
MTSSRQLLRINEGFLYFVQPKHNNYMEHRPYLKPNSCSASQVTASILWIWKLLPRSQEPATDPSLKPDKCNTQFTLLIYDRF